MKKNLLPILLVVCLVVLVGLRLRLAHESVTAGPAPPLDYPAALLSGQSWINERIAEYAFKDEIVELLCRERYAELEALATELQTHPRYFIHGWSGYDTFLAAFRRITKASPDEQTRYYARLSDWQIEMPRSKLAPLLVATYAVEAMQPANARSVAYARRAVAAAQQADEASAQPWVLAMEIETVTRGPRATLDAAFAEAQKREPDGYAAWYEKIDYLLQTKAPRAEILATLNSAADATKQKHGDSYYAMLIWHHKRDLHPHWGEDDVSWPRARQGFLDLGREYPYAVGALNGFALMAREAQDDGTARALAARIGSAWDLNTFNDAAAWRTFVQQVSQAPPSLQPEEIPYRPDVVARLIPQDHLSSDRRTREFGGQVNQLMLDENFDAVERIASTLRAAPPYFRSGDGTLYLFYRGFQLGPKFSDSQCEQYLTALKTWGRANPTSSTARVALAHTLIQYAWRARGSGYANTVTEQGWQQFHQRLGEAQKVLDGIEDDPQAFAEMSTVARGLSWSSTATRTLIDRATQKFPLYYALYLDYAQTLLPRWSGEVGDVEAFAERSADATRKELGETLYTAIGCEVYSYEGLHFFDNTRFKWPRIRQGVDDAITGKRPPSCVWLTAVSWLAWIQHDTATQVKCLRAVQDVDLLNIGSTPFAARAFIDGFERGYYQKGVTNTPTDREVPIEDAPLTATLFQAGLFDQATGAPRLIQSTDRVPLKDGSTFGIVLKLNRGSRLPHHITCTYIHPPYARPGEAPKTSETSESDVTRLSSPYLFATYYYGTQAPWEWVKGDWKVQISVDGILLGEQKFTVE